MNLILIFFLIAASDLRTSWDNLVEAEKSFARTSVAQGTRSAFLSVLADDSIIFRPRAVPGKKWMEDNPGAPGQLNWSPEFADIAASGDLGYTTGPWEFRRNPQDAPGAFGHYVTLWRKQANGEWKVELDNGIGHDQAQKPAKVDSPLLAKDVVAANVKALIEQSRLAVVNVDKNASSSLLKYFAGNVRLYRDGLSPLIGKTAAQTWLAQNAGSLTSRALDVRISNAADLAYSYGTAELAPQDKSKSVVSLNYLRIWKKQSDGSWKIVLDLLSPVPGGN